MLLLVPKLSSASRPAVTSLADPQRRTTDTAILANLMPPQKKDTYARDTHQRVNRRKIRSREVRWAS